MLLRRCGTHSAVFKMKGSVPCLQPITVCRGREGGQIVICAPSRAQRPEWHPRDRIAKTVPYYVYVLANQKNGTLYVGVTNNLGERVFAHKEGRGSAFTSKYNISRLVYYETFEDVNYAIAQEKRLKRWRRAWKIKLIEEINPDWDDLYLKLNH